MIIALAARHADSISIDQLYTRSYAIVIGISKYKEEKLGLKNPSNDAREVAKVLKEKHGFTDVELVLDSDATKEKLTDIFEDRIRGKDISKNDRLLVYYSGHGDVRISYDQQGRQYEESYIIPFDAKLGSYGSYLNLDTLTKNCKLCKAKHVLLILDSCYSGTAFISAKGLKKPAEIDDQYLRRITSKRSLQAVAATDKVQVALDSGQFFGNLSSEHGAFTGCLLEILGNEFDPDKDGILTASEVGAYLEKFVPRNGIPQNPIYGHLPGSEVGEFVFNLYNVQISDSALPSDEIYTIRTPHGTEETDGERRSQLDKRKILIPLIAAAAVALTVAIFLIGPTLQFSESGTPIVSISSPPPNAITSGMLNMAASASDDIGVTVVDFYVDQSKIGTAVSSPYTVLWDSTTVSNGEHTLEAVAYDADGNEKWASLKFRTSN